MKKESELRKELKGIIKRLAGQGHSLHVSWIESHATSPGYPDLEYCCYGVIGQIELKAGPDIEVRATQDTWIRERIMAGGYPLLLIKWGDVYSVVPGDKATDIRRNPSCENTMRLSSTIWTGSIPDSEFLKVIRNPRNEYAKSVERSRQESE